MNWSGLNAHHDGTEAILDYVLAHAVHKWLTTGESTVINDPVTEGWDS